MISFLALLSLLPLAKAVVSRAASSNDCVGTISSLGDVNAAVQCTTVNIHGFTVPPGQKFSLDLLQGTTVNILGDIQFGNKSWEGPLFEIIGTDITFNGNGHRWDGGGTYYWDGKGGIGGVKKPCPMMAIGISGTLSDVHVVNSPERAFALSNPAPLTVSGVTIDNSQGSHPNDKSNGHPAGRNTDGFDVTGNDLVIKQSSVINQDDCLAINKGKNIVFENNHCDGGHGISIGSIHSNVVVEDVTIRGNTVVNSMQAFRIKTEKSATNSKVTNISYVDNSAHNCTSYGLVITQSYPGAIGKPGNNVIISGINFAEGLTEISVTEEAQAVIVDCGKGSCVGTWNWSHLKTSGGRHGSVQNAPSITGYNP